MTRTSEMLNPPGRAPIRRVPARRVSDPPGAGPPGAAEAQDTMLHHHGAAPPTQNVHSKPRAIDRSRGAI